MRYPLLVGAVFVVLLGLAGCGGGGGTDNHNILPGDTGGVRGDLNVANASAYRIVLDGEMLDAIPQPDGSFEIPNLPPGDHTVALISGSGMMGAYLPITVEPGKTIDIGDIAPVQGGQIAGLVTSRAEDGTLTPLAGVEVIADPAPIYCTPGVRPAQVQPRQVESLTLRAITDDSGSYLMPAVPEGSYTVTVNVPGMVQGVTYVWVSAGATAAADFQLVAAIEEGVGTVSGHVTAALESGAVALAGAAVSIYSDGGWSPVPPVDPIPIPEPMRSLAVLPAQAECIMPPPYIFNEFTTLTASDGSYSLNVPSGHLQVSVWAEGYEGAWDEVTLQPNATETRDYSLKPWTEIPPVEPPVEGGGGSTGNAPPDGK